MPTLSAIITEIREYHGKKFECSYSGIWAFGMGCGIESYARVFTGTVISAVEISDRDKRLRLAPEEVFLGDPASEVTAITNQACLRTEIKAGDKWLFYLNRDRKTNELILSFGSPSKPIAEAQQGIATLRHLVRLADSGIFTGTVTRSVRPMVPFKAVPVPNRKIVAKRVSDGTEYSAFTDGNGHYELEVPPDSYRLTANTEPGLWGQEGKTFVWKRNCTNVDFLLRTDGRLSGRVTTADGKPAKHVQVAIVPVSPIGPQFSVVTDEQGHFEVEGRQPGSYLVGVGLLAQYDSPEWKSRVYYPGVSTKEEAKTIELGEGEWRTDINFKLSSSAAP
ncbi:MAG: carboxypeptidase-like regulatory domain-containing protein [Candidatus Korobacteraceae bacterium]